jgi:hypothetical protein
MMMRMTTQDIAEVMVMVVMIRCGGMGGRG